MYTCRDPPFASVEQWTVAIHCLRGPQEDDQQQVEHCFHVAFNRSAFSLNNIMAIRTRLNYGARGCLYYKKRNEDDPATATLVPLDYEKDVELMVECTAAEKKVTLVFSEKDFKNKDCVEITPVKRRRVNES